MGGYTPTEQIARCLRRKLIIPGADDVRAANRTQPWCLDVDGDPLLGGVATPSGDIVAMWRGERIVIRAALEDDNHSTPCFLIRESDQRILVFYSKHHRGDLFMRVSVNPLDPRTWGAETGLGTQLFGSSDNRPTYPNVRQLTGVSGSPLLMILRAHYPSLPTTQARVGDTTPQLYIQRAFGYAISTDDGVTWTTLNRLTQGGHLEAQISVFPYQGRYVYMFVQDGSVSEVITNSGYVIYYDGLNDTWHNVDGTSLSIPFVTFDDLIPVYEDVDGAYPITTSEIEIDPATGRPVCIYGVITGVGPIVNWKYAAWSGTTWEHFDLFRNNGTLRSLTADTDVVGYDGNLSCLDHDDPRNVVYYTRVKQGSYRTFRSKFDSDLNEFVEDKQLSAFAANTFQARQILGRNQLAFLRGQLPNNIAANPTGTIPTLPTPGADTGICDLAMLETH